MPSQISVNDILLELVKRANLDVKYDLKDYNFKKQVEAINDPASLKAYNCTRRAGKTLSIVIDYLESAKNFPRTKYLYMALTLDSARGICWDDFKEINEKRKLRGKPNESRSEIRFPNGSLIKLAGADCSEKQMRKVLGQKYKKVAIDEAGSFTIDMTKLVYQMIEPTLIDQNGVLILLGTCENIPNTFFQKVTEGNEAGWSVHKWSSIDNPYVRENFKAQIEKILKRNPLAAETSWFKTHYLNEWCTDDDLLIIKLGNHNHISELPQINKFSRWEFILGVDIGYNDANAFSVLAFNRYIKKAFVVSVHKKAELDFTGVYQHINALQEKYPFYRIVIDGANKQGVMELRNRFKLPLENAEKTGKATYLRILRDDVKEGKVLLLEGGCNPLITEWESLIWKDENKEEEDPRCQNHCSDATLYGWRECLHYISTDEPMEYDKNSDEYMDKLEQEEAKAMERKIKEEQEEEEWMY